ncbi:MAG: guanylate kinase [Deltaproteobacteria bacterium]|nr:guanylate kinase [Candidatus Zymogenaceae bacterium]
MKQHGIVFIFSAPSGAGKTTIARRVVQEHPEMYIGVSHTTRPPRNGEVEGTDYYFVDDDRFDELEREGHFLETASVHGNQYGTSRGEVADVIESGRDVILDIDIQGAEQIRQKIEAVGIFILPPSLEELARRLSLRGTDDGDVIRRRIENARMEIQQAHRFDYLVVNRKLDETVGTVLAVIRAERSRASRNRALVDSLLEQGG